MTRAAKLPDIGAVLAPLLERVPPEQQPLLIALAERMAADRYRGWASAADPALEARLLACAEREEEIAGLVEGLYPEASAAQAKMMEQIPELNELNRSLFAPLAVEDQYTLQASGERLGAATWRSFARQDPGSQRSEVFGACAELEEANARVLEAIPGGAGEV
jgi:hypothetical protein